MQKHFEEFVYHLAIRNQTAYDLVLAKRQLTHGVWFREGVDHQEPIAVPAGAEVEAMGIRAASDAGKGYECRCVWELNADFAGSMALHIAIPFVGGKNRAGLDVSGQIKVAGWTGVSVIGRRFSHTLAVART